MHKEFLDSAPGACHLCGVQATGGRSGGLLMKNTLPFWSVNLLDMVGWNISSVYMTVSRTRF